MHRIGHNLRYNDPLFLPNPNTNIPTNRTSNISTSEEADTLTTEGENPISNSEEAQPVADGTIDGPRRSARANKGQYNSTRYINEVFLSDVNKMECCSAYHMELLYQAELEIDMDAYENHITDPRVYNAKYVKKQSDPDTPIFKEATSGLEADKYIDAMKEEISNLKRMKTWVLVDREPRMKVLKGTWAFKLKRTPDGKDWICYSIPGMSSLMGIKIKNPMCTFNNGK